VWKITDISKSFFLEDWNFGSYFDMLKERFWGLRDIFLREYGSAGDWFFWGLFFFLGVILCIYIKSLSDMLKKSDEVLNEEIEQEDEEYTQDPEEYENYADETQTEYENEEIEQSDESDAEISVINDYDKEYPLLENQQTDTDEEEEMEKQLSTEIVRTSKISDDYLNLKDVLYKQSKANSEGKTVSLDKAEQAKSLDADKVWDLDQSVGVIINMLAHQVSDKKIAQTVYFLNKGADDPEEIMQLVRSIKNFIGYCNTGKFAQLPNHLSLPDCYDAVYSLALGDNKACMELMEALLNAQVAVAQRQKGLSKELSYALAADYACTMGTLANLNNYELAINSFELALDLAPKNVNALSRAADLYLQDNNSAKAAEIYQQVLNLADDVIYPEQKANANVKLAQYYKNSGKMFKADEMEKDGRKFFDASGIRNPLSDAEKKTLQILLAEQNEKLGEYIKNLL
jgi:tetratricopeptide (TPR) repeat protein